MISLNNSKITKRLIIFFLLTFIPLQGCNNMENKYNMDMNDTSIIDEYTNKESKKMGKCALFGLGTLVGIIIASVIEIPSILITKQNQLTSQNSQFTNEIVTSQSQLTLLANAIIPVLANNENAIYGLTNNTIITGNSNEINNLNYNDILGIKYVNLTSNANLYTAEEEFDFISLTQVLSSISGLQSVAFINQYISNPINLTSTSLSSFDVSGSYFNSR